MLQPVFVKFAYMLCLDLLEEKSEILLKDEESRERSLRLGKEPEETGYRRIRFLKKTVEKKDVNEERGMKKKKMPTEEPKFIYTATGSGINQLRTGSSEKRWADRDIGRQTGRQVDRKPNR